MKNKAFTLIEIIAALVILAVIALIAIPIVTTIIEKSEKKSDRISVENYAHAIELALAQYELETGDYPNTLDNLKINYTGSKVQCNVERVRSNGEIFLSECYVDGNKVEDKSTYDKYYHYGKSDYDLVDAYGKELENQTISYVEKNGQKPDDISIFETQYDSDVNCNVAVYFDGSIYLTACKVDGIDINDNTEDNYYHYGIDKSIAINTIISKANDANVTSYTDGNTGEMYTFSHSATEQTSALTDYRYIGENPNNYVYFNGDELWRIIGVFTVENETGKLDRRIKIMKNVSSNMQWNSNIDRKNKWENASLNTYFNVEYYNGLDSISRSMITETKYYLGGIAWNSTTHFGTAEEMYVSERGKSVYSGNSISWIGKIALIYPSDYTYTYALGVNDNCFNDGYNCNADYGGIPSKSWIFNISNNSIQDTLSSQPSSFNRVLAIHITGGFVDNTVVNSASQHPTLYLSSSVKFDSGDGTEQNPYKLKL